MKIEAVAAKRSRAHTRYKLKNGLLVPGVSTIIGVLNKPALLVWANNLGLAGIKMATYVDVLAEIGTIAHAMVIAHIKNEKFNPTNIPADLIDKAENCFLSYLEWERRHKVEPIKCEVPLVSEAHKYGGTMDFYGKIDGELTVRDFKTGKGIYSEYWYQVAAYRQLIEEHGHEVKNVGILNIPRTEDEEFSDPPPRPSTKVEWLMFWHCLQIYYLKKVKE
jgi:hypothetical protein